MSAHQQSSRDKAQSHHHAHSHTHSVHDNMRVAFVLNLLFAIVELFGGYATNSLAILSDALHDFGDASAIGLAWWLEHRAQGGRNARFSYGMRRLSLLGALINTVVLISGGLFLLSIAVPRLLHPQEVQASGMFGLAILGVAVNAYAVLRLRRDASMNARVMAWHLYEDLLGWIAVLVVSIVMWIRPTPILDPILSVLITLYVLYNVVRNLRRTLGLFLQGVPENLDLMHIENLLQQLPLVRSCHHTHVWSLDGEHHVLTTHLSVDESATQENLRALKRAVHALAHEHGFAHTTVEIEFAEADCSMEHGH